MVYEIDKIFPVIWTIVAVCSLTYFFITGKKALEIFPPISSVNVLYRNRFASGYSTKTVWYRRGRSNNALDIVITDKELWLKSMIIFAGIAKRNDLMHKIPLENILHVERDGNKTIIDFKSDAYEDKQVVIIVRDPDTFLNVLSQAKNKSRMAK